MGSLLDELGVAQVGPGGRSGGGGSKSKRRISASAKSTYIRSAVARRVDKPARPARVRGSKSLTRS